MQAVEVTDWSGLLVALGVVLGSLVGLFVVHRAYQGWIRWRTGFGRRRRIADRATEDVLPESQSGPSA